jgi:hypothetical protein
MQRWPEHRQGAEFVMPTAKPANTPGSSDQQVTCSCWRTSWLLVFQILEFDGCHVSFEQALEKSAWSFVYWPTRKNAHHQGETHAD